MEEDAWKRRLSQISTAWTLLEHAHNGAAEEAAEAKRRLLDRYGVPIYRYLLGALRDGEQADEIYQEFALRFVRGDLRRASPERGRFRWYLKTMLSHLISDSRRRNRVQVGIVEAFEPVAPPGEAPGDVEDLLFRDAWRDEILGRAWEALAAFDRDHSTADHPLLRLRSEEPDLDSAGLAGRLSTILGREITVAAVRKRLWTARERFIEFLLAEVAASLRDDSVESIEEELIDLGLLEYCRDALARKRAR